MRFLARLSFRQLVFATGLLATFAISTAQAAPPVELTLPNGLQVILRPLSVAQQTAVITLFSVGGDNDPEGACGLAHFVEHLYVTAAAGDFSARSAEQLMKAYPGGWNAQTGDDYTVYATVVAPPALDEEIKQHAQRMGDLKITDVDLRREVPRLQQELTNMFGRIPSIGAPNLARERVRPTPFKGRKGGRIGEIKQLKLEQLQARWAQLYKPANATLIVAGAFDPKVVQPLIEAGFGKIQPGVPVGPVNVIAEQKSDATLSTITVKPVAPNLGSCASLAFPTPKPGTDDYAPFLVLVGRMMMRSRAAGFPMPTEPKVAFAFFDDPNVLTVSAQLKEGESADDAAKRLRKYVDQAIAAPWNDGERMMTKQNFAVFLDTLSIPDGMLGANVYGVAFGLGRRRQLKLSGESLSKQIDRTNAEAVKRVGDRYLSAAHAAAAAVLTKAP